jgi:hypothetical protein
MLLAYHAEQTLVRVADFLKMPQLGRVVMQRGNLFNVDHGEFEILV